MLDFVVLVILLLLGKSAFVQSLYVYDYLFFVERIVEVGCCMIIRVVVTALFSKIKTVVDNMACNWFCADFTELGSFAILFCMSVVKAVAADVWLGH